MRKASNERTFGKIILRAGLLICTFLLGSAVMFLIISGVQTAQEVKEVKSTQSESSISNGLKGKLRYCERFQLISTVDGTNYDYWHEYTVYDINTGVMYLIICDEAPYGDGYAITPLYNSDGTLMIYNP